MEEPFCSSDHELLGFTTFAGLTEAKKKKPKEMSKVHLELLNFTKGKYTKVRMFIKTVFKRAELNHCTALGPLEGTILERQRKCLLLIRKDLGRCKRKTA